jgi:hypothetical protein
MESVSRHVSREGRPFTSGHMDGKNKMAEVRNKMAETLVGILAATEDKFMASQ